MYPKPYMKRPMPPRKAKPRSIVVPKDIGYNLQRPMLRMVMGIVSQLANEMANKVLVAILILGDVTTMKMPCIHRFRCLKKSEKVNGDLSCISPSIKSNENPWSTAFRAKKQSSAFDPSGPLSKDTCFSEPA